MIQGIGGLARRNLFFFSRENFAILLGSAIGAAVLAGAFIVGDSLRGSLRDRALAQLGPYETALTTGRLFRDVIPPTLPGDAIGVFLLQGSVSRFEDRTTNVNKVNVYGINADFGPGFADLERDQPVAILNEELAKRLQLKVDEKIRIRVQKASSQPRSSVLAARDVDETTQSLSLTVKSILPADHWASPFQLLPSPSAPLNLFLPLKYLQRQLDQDGRINAILHHGSPLKELQESFQAQIDLDDVGLTIAPKNRQQYLSIESKNLLIEPALYAVVEKALKELQLTYEPTLVYLVNRIHAGDQPIPPANIHGMLTGGICRLTEIPYSVVAALNVSATAPLGPILPTGEAPLQEDEILLTDWSNPTLLGVQPNKPLLLHFFDPEVEGQVKSRTATFRLRKWIPLAGAANDRDLTPTFPGITDKVSLGDWKPPFPYDNSWVDKRDEAFWNRYRATPKAFITLNAGKKLWNSRFGDLTSIRVAPQAGSDLVQLQQQLSAKIRQNLDAVALGFTFEPIREKALLASQGSNDFGMLFLGFSFFLILSALLLVGLLYRLNLERRHRQFGLMLATGFDFAKIQRLAWMEGFLLAIFGSLFGLVLAQLFAQGMLILLAELWPDRSVQSLLQLHVQPQSMAIGAIASILMSSFAIHLAIRGLKRFTPVQLIKGQLNTDAADPTVGLRWTKVTILFSVLAGVALLLAGPSLSVGEEQAGAFFAAGFYFLVAGIAGVRLLIRQLRSPIRGTASQAQAQFAKRNLRRNPSRSLLTIGVLASASFLLVAVESFRRQPEKDFLTREGGSGGFPLLIETDLPVFQDPQSEAGREELLSALQQWYQEEQRDGKTNSAPIAERLQSAEAQLKGMQFYPIRRSQGDDASCLNLFQTLRPQVLGVPETLIQRGGFLFSAMLHDSAYSDADTWKRLEGNTCSDFIPAFIEQNSAMYALKKSLGDVVELPDGQGNAVSLKLVGYLKDSIFQSQLIISEAQFRKAFPRSEGYQVFLVDPGEVPLESAQKLLSAAFSIYAGDVQSTREKVANYLAVQNSYLSTFQLLGGFGLLLGTFGLAAVLLRNIWERRSEVALLRALGYSSKQVLQMMVRENGWLLSIGLFLGVVAAGLSILPHVLGQVAIPWLRLIFVLGATFLLGLLVVLVSTYWGLRGTIVADLRQE